MEDDERKTTGLDGISWEEKRTSENVWKWNKNWKI